MEEGGDEREEVGDSGREGGVRLAGEVEEGLRGEGVWDGEDGV
jgi:hypothetical protein